MGKESVAEGKPEYFNQISVLPKGGEEAGWRGGWGGGDVGKTWNANLFSKTWEYVYWPRLRRKLVLSNLTVNRQIKHESVTILSAQSRLRPRRGGKS